MTSRDGGGWQRGVLSCRLCSYGWHWVDGRDSNRIAHYSNYGATGTFVNAFGSLRGISGFILLVLIFAIWGGAWDRVRRSRFEVFFAIHHLFVPFSVINLIHGPIFFWFFMIPGALYFGERLVRAWRSSQPTTLIRVRAAGSLEDCGGGEAVGKRVRAKARVAFLLVFLARTHPSGLVCRSGNVCVRRRATCPAMSSTWR